LPPKTKYHPVFDVSLLKPYHGDDVDQSRGISRRVPMGIKVQHEKEPEEVLTDRVMRHSNQSPTQELLVKWKGLPESDASRKPIQNLCQFKAQIQPFKDKKATRTSPKLVGEDGTGRSRIPQTSLNFPRVYSRVFHTTLHL